MAATTTWTKVTDQEDNLVKGQLYYKIYTFKGTASYSTGGEGVTVATDIGLDSADTIRSLVSCIDPATTYIGLHDATNTKIMFLVAATGVEVANTTNVSATVMTAVFLVEKG